MVFSKCTGVKNQLLRSPFFPASTKKNVLIKKKFEAMSTL